MKVEVIFYREGEVHQMKVYEKLYFPCCICIA